MGATKGSKRERWAEIAKAEKKCGRCPPHSQENAGRRQRPDRYKDQRKGR